MRQQDAHSGTFLDATMRRPWWLSLNMKSCCKRVGAMLKVWSLSVRRRENDPPDHFLTLLRLELAGPNNLNAVLAHQSPHPALSDLQAKFVQLLGHARPTVAAQAQAMLFADMRQEHQVASLAL